MPYKLTKTEAYKKAEAKYAGQIGQARLERMEAQLTQNPTYAPHITLMKGTDSTYRYRVGEFRVLYDVHEDEVEVLLLVIAPRGRAYR